MITVTFTGNVGKDGEIRTVSGTDVLNFNVAVRNGSKRDAGTNWFRVGVWGQRANFLAEHVKKGAKVAVTGELEIGEYDGKPQFNVRAHDVDPFCGGKREDTGNGAGGYRAPVDTSPDYDADLDSDVPFLRADGTF